MTERAIIDPLWARQLAFTSQLLATIDVPLEQLTDADRTRLTGVRKVARPRTAV